VNAIAQGTHRQYDGIWKNLWLPYIQSNKKLDPYLLNAVTRMDKVLALCFGLKWIQSNCERVTFNSLCLVCIVLKRRIVLCVRPGSDITFVDDPTVQVVKSDLKKVSKPNVVRSRSATTYDMIVYLRNICWLNHESDPRKWDEAKVKMNYLGVVLAFNFMLRISEYSASKNNPHTLLAHNVVFVKNGLEKSRFWSVNQVRDLNLQFGDIHSVNFNFATSKTDQPGAHNVGRQVTLVPATENEKELLRDLIHWCKISLIGYDKTDFFLSRYHHGRNYKLTSKDVTYTLRLAATHFNLNEKEFQTHSLRIGGITAKFRAGDNIAEIRKVAGYSHNSSTVNLYDRLNVHDRGALGSVDPTTATHSVLNAADLRVMQQHNSGSNDNVDGGTGTTVVVVRKRNNSGKYKSDI
jgi:hypothetical protein